MQGFLGFLYRYRAFLLFLLLELIAFVWMLQGKSQRSYTLRLGVRHVNGWIQQQAAAVYAFLRLKDDQRLLQEENRRLRQELWQAYTRINRLQAREDLSIADTDSTYQLIGAEVVSNQLQLSHNRFVINKGSRHGIEAGMGVISPQGVAGKVIRCSEHYAVVASLLDTDFGVPALIARLSHVSFVRWDGHSPKQLPLWDVPQPIRVEPGDTVVTPALSRLFPEGILIGVVESVSPAVGTTYHNIRLRPATDFSQLRYVYVVKLHHKHEIDELMGEEP